MIDPHCHRSISDSKTHKQFYKRMLKHDNHHAVAYYTARFGSRGLSNDLISSNLSRFPSTVPTTKRRHFFSQNKIVVYHFCNRVNGDDIDHWDSCHVLKKCFDNMFGEQRSKTLFNLFVFTCSIKWTQLTCYTSAQPSTQFGDAETRLSTARILVHQKI